MSERLRIRHVIPSLSLGGAERLAVAMANAANQEGHDVGFLLFASPAPGEDGILQSQLVEGVKVGVLRGAPSNQRKGLGRWKYRFAYYRTLLNWCLSCPKAVQDIDVLHVHLFGPSLAGAFIYGKLKRSREKGPKLVETIHTDFSQLAPKKLQLLMRSWCRKDGVIFEGNNDDREVFQRAFPSVLTTKVLVGTEPVAIDSLDPSERDSYRLSLNFPDDVFVISVIQRYRIQSKGIDRYPKLAAHLKKRLGSKFVMLLFGDGADSGALAELIASHQVGDVCRMMGMLTDLRLGLAIADLSLSGRHGRDTGVAGLQAAFCGIPGLGVQMKPGASDLHDWMPNSENLEELADLIVSLIEKPSELQELAIRQKAHVEAHHSTKSMTDGTLRFYKEVLGSKVTPDSALVDVKEPTNLDSFAVGKVQNK